MNREESLLDEARENLKEAARLVRTTQNRIWSAGMDRHPNYRDLTHRGKRIASTAF